MMVFFCGNTYKNTLQNVTTNRETFLNFSAAPVKNLKNEMNIRGIFFDHLKGGDGNQRENPHNDLFPVPQSKKTGPPVLQL